MDIGKSIIFFLVRFLLMMVFSVLILSRTNSVFAGCRMVDGVESNLPPFPNCPYSSFCSAGEPGDPTCVVKLHEYWGNDESCFSDIYCCDTDVCATGGGGHYQYFNCPEGQTESCGTQSEAQAQGKYACLTKSYCDTYFSPELIGAGCDADNPAKAICQTNCSCCPTGSYRTCTQGSQYDVTITIDLTNESIEAREAKKVSCNQYHGHDDIFVSNVMTRNYYNQWDDHLQDWQLTCIQNTCGCVAPPTATPTPTNTPTPTRTPTPTPTRTPTPVPPTPTSIPPPTLTCTAYTNPVSIVWNWTVNGVLTYWLQVWNSTATIINQWYTGPTVTTSAVPGVTQWGHVLSGDGTQSSLWSNTASCTVPALSTPTGTCGTFDPVTVTTPVTWTWANGTGLQVYDATGKWWANIGGITFPYTYTVTKDNNNLGSTFGIPPGRVVSAHTTYDFASFSALGTVTCPLPANQTAVISGVLRQKSGTGCYQADASNNFNITNLSGSTGDSCVTINTPCTFSLDQQHAVSYSCIVTWDNAGCVAQGRQPNTTQTLTLTSGVTGYSPGQFSNSSCTLGGTTLPITAGVNNLTADIAFQFTGNNWIKLKDSSYTGVSITGITVPGFVTSYDADDDATKYFIIGNAGSVLNTTVSPSTGYSSPNNWYAASYTKSSLMNPSGFLSYVKSRKQYTKITNLSQITADGIYVWDELVSFPDITNTTTIPNFNFVLISTTQAITISRTNFDPAKSVALVANSIIFGASVQTANGIFIAQTIDTSLNGNQGLKIKGNLITLTTLTNGRAWSDTSRPGLFVVFDPVQYINLLPYLSTTSYDWRQIQ